MKKIILSFLVMTIATTLFSQVCVPTTPTSTANGYIIPDSATNFNNGCAGVYYEQLIYIKAPADTSITYLGFPVTAHVDSFVIGANVTGLPSSLMVESVPALQPAPNARLIIPSNSKACIKISGIMPATASGTINLSIPARAYLTVASVVPLDTAINVNYYHIVITPAPCSPANVQNVNKPDFVLKGIIPNPADEFSNLYLDSKEAKKYSFKLMNSFGQIVMTQELNTKAGLNAFPINITNFANGMYLYTITDGKHLVSEKLQISK